MKVQNITVFHSFSDLQEAYQEMLNKEQERVAEQQRKILALRQNLRVHELDLLDAAKDRLMKQHVEQRCVALNQLLDDIKWKV
jgi:aspartate/methionine/tyrosine aminotransferase